MATSKELKNQLGELLNQKDKLVNDIESRENKEFTAEERTKIDEIFAKVKLINEDISRAEALEEMRSMEKPVVEEKSNIVIQESRLETDIKNKKYRFGNFLQDINIEARTHQKLPQVIEYQKRVAAENRAILGGSESVPSDGGYLVGTDMLGEIIQRTFVNNQVISRVDKRSISSNSNSMKINAIDETSRVTGSRGGAVQTYWESEGASKTSSKVKFRQISLELKKLIGLYYATDEVLQDAMMLEGEVSNQFVKDMEWMIQDAIINGTGAGQPLGIMNSPALVTVAKETGQTAATIVYKNIVKMYSRALGNNLVWIANRDIFSELAFMELPVGTGGAPVYLPANGAAGQPFSTLMGLPLIFVEQCQTLGTTGDIILCDLGSYLLADKGGIQAASSIHVQFTTDQTTYRWVYRADGQTKPNSALTPSNGSNTQSEFVALATRA